MRPDCVELPFAAERGGPVPLTEQVATQLREAMADGRLNAGERLPSTRALALLLGVSRTVVTAAYAQLFAEGWIEGRHGSGTYVAEGAPGRAVLAGDLAAAPGPAAGGPGPGGGTSPGGDAPREGTAVLATGRGGAAATGVPTAAPPALVGQPAPVTGPAAAVPLGAAPIELRPGVPWARGLDRAAWRRAWRGAGTQAPAPAPDPQGLASLRTALTGYLRRARGIRCGAEQVLVTRGVAGGLRLIAAALLQPGDLVGVEEPGYPAARAVFAACGARVVPCRVDGDGLVVSELPAGLKLVYTTPAHQYPLGGRLPVPRRQALTAWARSSGALIIEDDYDGEFRYDVAPLPTLFGMDPEVVIYLGTTSKTMTPALRLGWLVARPDLAAFVTGMASLVADYAAEPVQHAVLAMLRTGDLERHIRRMRHEYSRRRAAMSAALGDGVVGCLTGDEAGMHMVLRTGHDAEAAAEAALAEGVAVATVARYFAGPPTVNGLVLGYGGAAAADVARGCKILAGILAATPLAH